ncbi:MAG: tRNA lysidine(34) synthetase TilS [Chloroflexota bacterium]
MLQRVSDFIQNKCGLVPELAVVVGVSGGPDSLMLLHVLHRLGYKLIVAHLDHMLRPESGEEAEVVRKIAEKMNLPFESGRERVAEVAADQGLAIEEAARVSRYRFLFSLAEGHSAQAVAVGHIADDQVETVIMHLLRGAGLSGLKGMLPRLLLPSWSDCIPLVRPLLSVWRHEVLDYCERWHIQPVFDRSNLDTTFFRNRIRHELLPELESYNPSIRERLWHTAEILAGDEQVLSECTDDVWKGCVSVEGAGYVGFDTRAFADQSLGMQRRLIRKAVARLRPGLRDVDFDLVARAVNFFYHPTSSGIADLGEGLYARYEFQLLYLVEWGVDLPDDGFPQLESVQEVYLNVPGSLQLSNRWELHASELSLDAKLVKQVYKNADPFQCWLDAEVVQVPIIVRCRRPGDRFQPLGMDGQRMKLADFMVNVKLLERLRARWPLVCSGKEIIWVPGYRPGHPYRVTSDTSRVIHLKLICSSGEKPEWRNMYAPV